MEAEFTAWVDARAWNTGDGARHIFTDGMMWLRTGKVLLPRVTTLARKRVAGMLPLVDLPELLLETMDRVPAFTRAFTSGFDGVELDWSSWVRCEQRA